MLFKKKYIAIFLTKNQNSYDISKKIRITSFKEKLSYNDKMYPVILQNYSFSQGLKFFYCFDLSSGNQLLFVKGKKSNMDLKFLDNVVSKDLIKKLTLDMTGSNVKQKIFDMIIGALIGGLTSFIIAGFVFGGFA